MGGFVAKGSFYQKSLKEDIKLINSEYNDKLVAFIGDVGIVIGSAALAVISFMGVTMLSGNIALGLAAIIISQGAVLSNANNLEAHMQSRKKKYELSKYCASERVEALSEKLREIGMDASYETIKDSKVINSRNIREQSLISSRSVEEDTYVIGTDISRYQLLRQRVERLRYLRDKAEVYDLACMIEDEEGYVKVKRI